MQKLLLVFLLFLGIIPVVHSAENTLEVSITPIRNNITVTFDTPAT